MDYAAIVAIVGPILGLTSCYLGIYSMGDDKFPLLVSLVMFCLGMTTCVVSVLATAGTYPLLVSGRLALALIPGILFWVSTIFDAWRE